MTKSGVVRLIVLILFFFFLIFYFMQINGYNEYAQNRKNMLTEEQIKRYEEDIEAGRDVSIYDYLENEKNYDNLFSKAGLSVSNFVSDTFQKSMSAIFKMLEGAMTSS